jgi:hypothetical protein
MFQNVCGGYWVVYIVHSTLPTKKKKKNCQLFGTEIIEKSLASDLVQHHLTLHRAVSLRRITDWS